MSVLVTGGAGFVGLNIAEALLNAGHEVLIFDQAAPPQAAMTALSRIGPAVTAHEGDVTDRRSVSDIFAAGNIDYVVHGAAITADAAREARDARRIIEVNLLGTIEVLEAARRHQVRRLVYLSSSSVYGENCVSAPELDEVATPPVPDSLYAISKYAGERAALRYRELYNLDIVAARLSAVFGPWERDTGVRDTLSPIYHATLDARAGRDVVLPRACMRDWVYVRDVGTAVTALLTAPTDLANRVYNIGPGKVWTVADWCAKLAEKLPNFSWRIALAEPASIDLHGDLDRHPLAIERITTDTAWRPAFGLEEAFDDYMSWLSEVTAKLEK